MFARLAPDRERQVVLALRHDDGREILVAVAERDGDVGRVGDDNVGALDVGEGALLRERARTGPHACLGLRIAVFRAGVVHDLLAGHF
ncbi:MAG: hypothetical protein IPG50_37640 [Myxococcales bacterium]|nr:hypothetical protein [Myxococcales bacterium]